MAMTYTPIPHDFLEEMEDLTDEEYGQLIRWCQRYFITGEGEKEDLTGNARFFAVRCRNQLDYSKGKYDAKMKAQKENGKKGGRPRKSAEIEETKDLEDESEDDETEKPTVFSENPKNPWVFETNPEKPKKPIKRKRKEKENKKHENITPLNPPSGEEDAGFIQFWAIYPRKVGKQAAIKAWSRLKPDEELTKAIIEAVEYQKKTDQWTHDGGKYIPHPATWLNGRRWEDEIPVMAENPVIRNPNPREVQLEQLLQEISADEGGVMDF